MKALFIGLLIYLGYKLISPTKKVNPPKKDKDDELEYSDYEEID